MLLYLVESESSRIFCCEVYKPIGIALDFSKCVFVEVSLRAQSLYSWRRPCLLKCDRGRVHLAEAVSIEVRRRSSIILQA